MTQKKIGVYICTGCEIGDALDIEALSKVAEDEYQTALCKTHPSLCNEEGTLLIKQDIADEQLEGVVIAACSPRVNTYSFSFDSQIVNERVNLREQIVWSHPPNDEDTQMMAEDNLRMGIIKADKIAQPTPFIAEDMSSDILVVGGGITGITAAIEAAKAGYKVILVEKEQTLGGWAAKLHKQLPLHPPYQELEDPIVNGKISELKENKNITALTSSEIVETSGQPGEFNVKIIRNGNEETYKVATIVLATGWKPYDANKLEKYGYGKLKNVITSIDMEKLAKEGNIVRPSDGKEAKKVLFIQCAGSRDEEHLPYCSSFCCGTTLKQAKYVREVNRDSSAYIIYKDIRTLGVYENFYKEIQNDEQIFLTKGEVESVVEEESDPVVIVKDTLIGEDIKIGVDMVVLATGMTPANTEELNLTYRLGKGLPDLKYDFPDSHFICFPYESRRTGIYAAGALRAPMDMSSAIDDATGAALKAIQCLECLKRGEAVHPRAGDQTFPDLYLARCTDCKRCTEECPFGAYDENEKGTPLPNPNRCRRCGICLGSCPERIINFSNYTVDGISSMVKAVEIPDEDEEKPRILVFVCENDAYPALDMAGYHRLSFSAYVRIIPVRCIGSVNKVWINDALAKGYDGILQLGCKPGDDYQCHFIKGSELTETRNENIQEILDKMMLERERVQTEFVEINDYDKIPKIINDYAEEIEEMGPNPFKSL